MDDQLRVRVAWHLSNAKVFATGDRRIDIGPRKHLVPGATFAGDHPNPNLTLGESKRSQVLRKGFRFGAMPERPHDDGV